MLIVIDGLGCNPAGAVPGNAVEIATTPTLDRLLATCAHTKLETSGEAVGLPTEQMGNSEVGHMNLGAGRVIHQTLTRVDKAIRDGGFFENPALVGAVDHALESGGRLHVLGLVSDGGVHSHTGHLEAVLQLARRKDLVDDGVLVHAFTDGRDTGPRTGLGHVTRLEARAADIGAGRLATVCGRYWAMDRDKRWDRTKRAYDAIVRGEGPRAADARDAIEASYEKGVGDEFVEPVVLGRYDGMRDGDSVLYANFRPDRARQLTRALAEAPFDGFDVAVRPRLHVATMVPYEATWPHPAAFGPEQPANTIGELVAARGWRQLRVAETEKYAHVTYFLNGGREAVFPGEDRILVPSPKVPTYDHRPEMSADEVTDRVLAALDDDYRFVCLNFANCDMVGHTGDIAATVRAIETVDACLGRILAKASPRAFHVFVTADHGNAEEMVDAQGGPQTAHTTYPVPLFHVPPSGAPRRSLSPGVLADVAPTLCEALGVPQPREMTGRSLFADRP
ncbi:MAG TPA: 2,3-bisphosphoglycerate-independent phosphoglycerate mutase [Candidatus Thermoplasmatota archaeon]|nr:2,3-bisphosphoglycerate-independent phosphoglycerate mutase [Candidatus Thermoplasmatota archaeon]